MSIVLTEKLGHDGWSKGNASRGEKTYVNEEEDWKRICLKAWLRKERLASAELLQNPGFYMENRILLHQLEQFAGKRWPANMQIGKYSDNGRSRYPCVCHLARW